MIVERKDLEYAIEQHDCETIFIGKSNERLHENLKLESLYNKLDLRPNANVTLAVIKANDYLTARYFEKFMRRILFPGYQMEWKAVEDELLIKNGLLETGKYSTNFSDLYIIKRIFGDNGHK